MTRLELIKQAHLKNETPAEKYHRIKNKIKKGIFVEREDFMYVKVWDQKENARYSLGLRQYHVGLGPVVVYSGYNGVKK